MRTPFPSLLPRPWVSSAIALLLCNIAVSSMAQTPCEWSNTSTEPASGGPVTTQVGQYHNNGTYYLTFDALSNIVLESVRVFANGAGNRSIALIDPAGNIIEALQVAVPDGESVISLGFEIAQGSGYGLRCINENPQLWRDGLGSTLTFPYAIGDLATITGTSVEGENTLNFYYFFYDWTVSPGAPTMVSGGYPCWNVELMDVAPIEELGGGDNGNDCWGWVDPNSGREIAIYCRSNGSAIIDVTDATQMKYFANIPTATTASLWRDAKVFNNHLFIVSEAGGHGMQVVDLQALMTLPTDQVTVVEPVAHYTGFGNAHNIAINEETGFAYPIGSNTFNGGLHIVDISNPASPVLAGSFDGYYSHDVQSVVYQGPDATYAGREMIFCFNGGNGFAIVDAEDKQDVNLVSTLTYAQLGYTHQGWLSEDHRYCFLNDELDELNFGNFTRTYVVDIQDLDAPQVVGFFEAPVPAIDHNLYVVQDKIYEANYNSGLRILNQTNVSEGVLDLVGYFDTNPGTDEAAFDGAWSTYPYFPSGNVAISTMSHFFMVKPDASIAPGGGGNAVKPVKADVSEWQLAPNPAQDRVRFSGYAGPADLEIRDAAGRLMARYTGLPLGPDFSLDVSAWAQGMYFIRLAPAGGSDQGSVRKLFVTH